MTLSAGTKLGPYEIVAPIGAGGMGEVYKARDTRLERTVAVKVLPSHLSSSADSRQRFEREAKTISQLSHPHICALHDVGSQDGVEYLVMEYLEGETLSDRLAKGPLPLEQTLRYGQEIADALDKAHRQGIVHRDLKPGNVMLTKSGVKLLDFGLAKAFGQSERSLDATGRGQAAAEQDPMARRNLTALPTMAGNLTAAGTILGTFQYMAPEQLEGKDADARTDIFAFGATLYEMATGKKAFSGASQASLISAIMQNDPPPISSVQPMSPPALDRIVKTCLAKDPEDRWQSASDLKRELRWIAEGSTAGARVSTPARRIRREAALWILSAVVGAALAMLFLPRVRPGQATTGPLHSYLLPPEKTAFRMTGDDAAPIVVSPDGRRVVFGASGKLWVQALETGASSALPSTSAGKFPFWSPDSRWIGFFAEGKLKTIEASGGPIQEVCGAPNPRGGAWSSEGVIVFAPDIRTPLFKVQASGGKPEPLTVLDAARHTTHRWPEFVADGRHLVYLAANHNTPESEETGVYLTSLDGKGTKRLFASGGSAQWVPGWILSMRDTSLIARPFDDRKLAFEGEPVRVAGNAHFDRGVWRGVFSASRTGVLAYQVAPSEAGSRLTWVDRSGKGLETVGERTHSYWPRLSPDGRRVAVLQGDPNNDIWVYELGRGTRIRLTTSINAVGAAVWSPDGSQIAWVSQARLPEGFDLFIAPSNGSSDIRKVATFSTRMEPTDWSRDGRYLLYNSGNLGATDMYALPLADPSKPIPVVRSQWNEGSGQISPDGKWVVYVSIESGRGEVYVTPFPSGGARWQVSTAGGNLPRWRRDGRELYFLTPDGEIMAAGVAESKEGFAVSSVKPLFRANFWMSPRTDQYPYDVVADGQRFLIIASGDAEPPRIALVTNWTAGLER